jgi:hypothetical protein
VIISEGSIAGVETSLPVPALRPFARAWIMAEVRAEPEEGIEPVPQQWSASTPPVELLEIPGAAPAIQKQPEVAVDAANVTVRLAVPGAAHAPVPGPYRVLLYERAGGGAWGLKDSAAVEAEVGTIVFTPIAGADYQIFLVDPIGRKSAPTEIVLP